MPRGKSRKARRSRKRGSKPAFLPRDSYGPLTIYRAPGVGVPDEFYTHLVYTTTLAPSAASVAVVQLQSSLFDPDPALGGSQPTFFDQLAALYGRYQVLGMSAMVEFTQQSSIPTNLATAWTIDQPSTSILPDTLAMYRFSRMRSVNGVGSPTGRFNESMSCNRVFGYRSILELQDTQALVSANPARMMFFTISTVPADGATADTRFIRVKMTYHCRFFQVVSVAPS